MPVVQRANCDRFENSPPRCPSKTNLPQGCCLQTASQCRLPRSLPHLTWRLSKAGMEGPGHFAPLLDTLGSLGLMHLPIYCHNWLKKDQYMSMGTTSVLSRAPHWVGQGLVGSITTGLLLPPKLAYFPSSSVMNALLTKCRSVCFWRTQPMTYRFIKVTREQPHFSSAFRIHIQNTELYEIPACEEYTGWTRQQ